MSQRRALLDLIQRAAEVEMARSGLVPYSEPEVSAEASSDASLSATKLAPESMPAPPTTVKLLEAPASPSSLFAVNHECVSPERTTSPGTTSSDPSTANAPSRAPAPAPAEVQVSSNSKKKKGKKK
mmetsp:Transcript_26183/g.66514  ORF Transcript_26183/g.66514 Transcript_26183/m.66514 type:complete len:126 (-) Transcript_26183:450-827(-)|eukprot:CAMPEP_0115855412 /NCGR_PEP_ID=MMETSP0287-20121206/14528_1 /TAXON_ID=412157 /ORGANISM="Chrysochromulina rotalis, Strain UIO044" /LENGTH=125 /DNA_ID=CAMNT_0003309563 /DNA_START=25 /DNA_END=402 /DNA_ORIENTATION=+